ncbi:MAG: metallophosphoesterase family protein [Anaerolineales bacterium]|nr:metallophosphoesterase family protein [Anaerolineales bacterium]
MRILVISDVHANFIALEAVLKDAGPVDETWCLGDIVGYGPDPNLCLEYIREIPQLTCVLGNHDVALLGHMSLESFNGEAKRSLIWQERVLTADNIEFLKSLPQNAKVRHDFTLAHGSPRDPVWEYIINTFAAHINFEYFDTPWCAVGHSHVQCMFELIPGEERNKVSLEVLTPGKPVKLKNRAILNPGSVGQPRDRDPRAAYAIYDTKAKTWEPRRVEYNIAEVQRLIREKGLPDKHAVRLEQGW